MPYTITLEHVPAGYSMKCAEKDEEIDVVFREFTSTEDGQLFISRLEGIPTKILEKISGSANVAASETNSLLAIIQPGGRTKVYWNEFQPSIQIRSKQKIKAGELVYMDHIMDIERVKLPDEALAPDAAICYVFSFGWRKGLFYDFGPAQPGKNRVPRNYDIGVLLGHYFGRVLFQHLFSIEDETWTELFRQRWFPFSYLSVDTVQNMIKRARERRAIDVELDKIATEVQSVLGDRLTEWENDEVIGPHLPFIQKAFDHFSSGDSQRVIRLVSANRGTDQNLHSTGIKSQSPDANNPFKARGRNKRLAIARAKSLVTETIRAVPRRCLLREF